MKAILQSIKPQYCELIAAGKKTIEVRKTKPNIPTPFKVYIYCTKARTPIRHNGSILMYEDDLALTNRWGQGKRVENPCGALTEEEIILNGKVIGEYVCNDIDKVVHAGTTNQNIELCFLDSGWNYTPLIAEFYRKSCLTYTELEKYSKGGDIYGYHISNLVIYDKPKELSEFQKCYTSKNINNPDFHYKEQMLKPLTRPPQSWCYVEKI